MSVKTKWLALGFSALSSTLGLAVAGEAKAQSVCEARPTIRVQPPLIYQGRGDTVCRDPQALVLRDPDAMTFVAGPNQTLAGGIDARAAGDLQVVIPTSTRIEAAGAGLLATSLAGSTSVVAGPITTFAEFGSGIYAEAAQSLTVTARGEILTNGRQSYGVAAVAQGPVNVAVTAPVTVWGIGSTGVAVASDTSMNLVVTGPVRGAGLNTTGIEIASNVTGCRVQDCGIRLASATVSFSEIDMTGGTGVRAFDANTNGPITITGGRISSNSAGLSARSLSSVTADLGTVTTTFSSVLLTSGTLNTLPAGTPEIRSGVSLTVGTGSGGGVTSVGQTAIGLTAVRGDAELAVRPGAVVFGGGRGVDLVGETVTIRNRGHISSGAGEAIFTSAGQVRIFNEGTILGRMDYRADFHAANLVDLQNTGRLELSGASRFASGSVIRNQAAGVTTFTGAVALNGLARFENAGVVSGVNGQVGEVLSMPGVFVAQAGGRLAVDVSSTGADRLEVGQLQGTLAIQLNAVGQLGVVAPTPIVIAQSGTVAASLAGGPSNGLVEYSLRTNGGRIELVGAPAQGAFETTVLGAVSANAWHKAAGAWRGRAGSGVWIAGQQSEDLKYEAGGAFAVFGSLVTPDLSYAQDYAGLAVGADKGFEVGGGHVAVGVMAGRQISDVRFDVSGQGARLKGTQVGAYASGEFGRLSGQVLAMRTAVSTDGQAKGRSHGVMGEVGYRLDLTPALSVRPLAGLALVDTKLKSYAVGATTVSFDDLTSLRASLGAEAAWKAGAFTPYVRVAGVQELARTHDVTVSSATGASVLRYKPKQASGEVEAGIRLQSGKFAGGLGVQSQFGDVEGVTVSASAAVQF